MTRMKIWKWENAVVNNKFLLNESTVNSNINYGCSNQEFLKHPCFSFFSYDNLLTILDFPFRVNQYIVIIIPNFNSFIANTLWTTKLFILDWRFSSGIYFILIIKFFVYQGVSFLSIIWIILKGIGIAKNFVVYWDSKKLYF